MNEGTKKQRKGKLASDLATRLRRLIAGQGEESLANALDLSVATLAKAASGCGVEAGTRARVELGVARLEAVSRETNKDAALPMTNELNEQERPI